ncbi:MAG: basic amino acid ABC transporter substrate-binding protein [Euryarchaeota archaeon]|nr:basic amino acid ABC transporter substrate-binding protein [Euryarchaeota archaeon]
MKKEWKCMGLLVATAMVLSILSGCIGGEEEKGKIVVGTATGFAPFEYKDDDGNIVGFDIDMIKKIAEDQGYEVEVKDLSFDALIASLKSEKIDVIAAAMTITDERAEQISFSDPYYEADQSILVRKGYEEVSSSDDLAGLKVGAQTGTTGAAWVKDNIGDENLNRYESYLLCVKDLTNGNIDAVVLDTPVAKNFEGQGDVVMVVTMETGEEYGLGVGKDNEDLLKDLNEGLENLMGSDEWSELIEKYFS